MKSYPGIKKIPFIRQFHPGIKRVELHNRLKLCFKENFQLSVKTYNMI